MKLSDWQSRLFAFVESKADKPFAWGSNDCARFAFDAALSQTGRSVLSDVSWSNARQASRVLKRFGGVSGLATAAFGTPKHPAFAQRGDVVAIEVEEHPPMLAVCVGSVAVGPGKDGLVRVPMNKASTAWSVEGEN